VLLSLGALGPTCLRRAAKLRRGLNFRDARSAPRCLLVDLAHEYSTKSKDLISTYSLPLPFPTAER
jgi:hypothetical protein